MVLKQGSCSNNKFTVIPFLPMILIIAISTVLTACGGKDDTKVEAQEDKSIVLSESGIGPINASSSFNMHQMTLAFSDYNVIEEVNYQSGHPFPIIRVSEGVKSMMTIIPDASQQNIYSVIVEDNIISNSLGHHLGTSYSDVYAYGQNEECQLGSQDMAAKVLCYAPKTPNILYVFNGQKTSTNTSIPPADVLQGWALESIIWRPKQ